MKIKQYALVFTCSILSVCLFAQVPVQDVPQEIAVPDVSTAIGGESFTIDEQAVPDFSLILPEVETDFLLSLSLPDINESTEIVSTEDGEKTTDPTFSLEGVLGGGYPGYFVGDISLSQQSDVNPFKVDFVHISQNGLGSHLAADGFTQSDTSLLGESTLIFNENYALKLGAQYETSVVGFQDRSPLFYLGANQLVSTDVAFEIDAPASWNITIFSNADWMNRYVGSKASIDSDILRTIDMFEIHGGFSIGKDFSMSSFDTVVDYSYTNVEVEESHRIDIGVGFDIDFNDFFHLDTSVGLVAAQNLLTPVLVPFTIGLNIENQKLDLAFSGGMKTEEINYVAVQKEYSFSNVTVGTGEEAQWFTSFDMKYSLFEKLMVVGNVHFEKTAFNHGSLLPDYSTKDTITGLYDIFIRDVLLLNSNIGLDATIGIFGVSIGWNSAWLDVLPGENANELYALASYTSETGRWGSELSISEAFSHDYTPNISATAFVKVSPSFQLELQLYDFVKLVNGKDRNFAGDYVTDSAYIGLFARLYI